MATEEQCTRAVREGLRARAAGPGAKWGKVVGYCDKPMLLLEFEATGGRGWVPADAAEVDIPPLLTDPQGEPYPEEVQAFFSEWQPTDPWRARLVEVLEAVREPKREARDDLCRDCGEQYGVGHRFAGHPFISEEQ